MKVSELSPGVRQGRAAKCSEAGLLVGCAVALLVFSVAAPGQQGAGPRSKIPMVNKIDSYSPTRAAFTGSIQMLNRKMKVLGVNGAAGQSAAIFPLGKKVKISSVSGTKLKWAALTPGTNVIVYYQVLRGRRTVQQIVVLGHNKAPLNKNKAHSS